MPSAQEIIDAVLEPFDQTSLIETFNADTNADNECRDETKMLALELIVSLDAWANARLDLETHLASENLEKEMDAVAAVEAEQEHTRARLAQFVGSIQEALILLAQSLR